MVYYLKMRIDFVRFSKNAICPTKCSADAAGFDIYSTEEVLVPPSNVRIVPTDIGFKIPKGYLAKFIQDLALRCNSQMSVVE